MAGPRQLKLKMKEQIIAVLERDGSAQRDILTSSLKLDSGFNDKVITEMINDLEKVGYICIEANRITLTEKKKQEVDLQ